MPSQIGDDELYRGGVIAIDSHLMAQRRHRSSAVQDRGYPRPGLQRAQWTSFNGIWDFAIDREAMLNAPSDVRWTHKINVPFSPETRSSGINDSSFYKAVWYRRKIDVLPPDGERRAILHFGAVDHTATVWLNDHPIAHHEGGYTPFSCDITDQLSATGPNVLAVCAFDDPHDLAKPRGKQDWRLEPHSIWYPRTTGIWQTVWLEVVPRTRIAAIRWMPDVAKWQIGVKVAVCGPLDHPLRLRVRLSKGQTTITDDLCRLTGDALLRTIELSDPGIGDQRGDLLWSPRQPNLIDAQLELIDDKGEVIDSVTSYTAMRTIAAQGERLVLNGQPLVLRLVLDQGYWPESGLTAPDDEAYRKDTELIKSLGFNGVRLHQKIEDPRFLYWADHLGLLVWEEMPSAYRFSAQTIERVTREWIDAIARDVSHPCIIAWVPFNESWGMPDLPEIQAQRDFVSGIYHLTKALDPSRPVIGNDGWEMANTDIIAIHDYEQDPQRLKQRYHRTPENLAALFAYERPGHRQLLLEGQSYHGHPIMLSEFGGIAYHKDISHTWGYRRARTAVEFKKQYARLLEAVRALPIFSGFCYTQYADTYQEANGLVYMDRTPKLPIGQIAGITAG